MSLDVIKLRVVLDVLLDLESEPFAGAVYRTTAAEALPLQGSFAGRWAAGPAVEVLYTNGSAAGAVSELVTALGAGDALDAARKYVLHELSVTTGRVVRLTSAARLQRLGVTLDFMGGRDYEPTQRVAAAAYQLGIEGLIVPGVTGRDVNLVLFCKRVAPDALRVVTTTRLSPMELRDRRLKLARV